MDDIYWLNISLLSNGELEDAAELVRDIGRPAAFGTDGVSTKLRWRTGAWMAALSFVVMWVLASRLSALLISSNAMATLIGLWIAVNGMLIVNAVLLAWKRTT